MSDATLARRLETIPEVHLSVATFVDSNGDGTVDVDFGEGPIKILAGTSEEPTPGTSVRVLQVNGATLMVGPAIPRAPIGEVVGTGGTLLTVDTSVGTESLPFVESYATPTIGDQVLIVAGYVVGKVGEVPASTYVPAPAPTVSGAFTTDFRATDSGTWYVPGGTYNRNDIYAVGTGNNIGVWVYDGVIAGTLPDAATIHRVQIYLSQLWANFSTDTALGLHTLTTLAGAPTVTDTTGVDIGSGWRDLPTSFGDALKTGAKHGIGTGISGEAMYAGRAKDADSGLLRIDWSI